MLAAVDDEQLAIELALLLSSSSKVFGDLDFSAALPCRQRTSSAMEMEDDELATALAMSLEQDLSCEAPAAEGACEAPEDVDLRAVRPSCKS